MSSISNTVNTPQKGLVSTNPFLNSNLKTSGTTTPMNNVGFVINKNITQPNVPQANKVSTGVSAPINTGITGVNTGNMGVNTATTQSNSNQQNAGANTYNNGVNANGQTFPGYVSALANTSSQPTSNFNQAQDTASAAARNLLNSAPQENQDVLAQKDAIQGLTNQYNGAKMAISGGATNLAEAGGEQGLLQNLYTSNLGAMQTGLSNILQSNAQQQAAYTGAGNVANATAGAATSQQGTQQSGLNNAAGLVQPTQVPYSNQYINPMTGQPVTGGVSGATAMSQLPQQAQDAINSYAEQVKNGGMTRQDAENRISAYGIAGTNALNESLGSGFNTNASNASSGTTAVGQQISAAIPAAEQALDSLQVAFNNLGPITGSSIPILNQLTQGLSMSTGVGRDQTSAFQGALTEARSRIDAALQGAIGVDAARAQASALLPDNMVPSELPQKIAAAKQYLQNQLKGYSQSGQQNGNTNTNSGGSINTPYGAIDPNL